MAEGYTTNYAWPQMDWKAADLSKEWERFYQHCQFAFGGPLSKATEQEKICHLMTFVGDKGREMYLCFEWGTVERQSRNDKGELVGKQVSEKDSLEAVVLKFKTQLESKRNPIMAAVQFDRRKQRPEETFDDFVTDLKLLARGLDLAETEKLIRNAIACKSDNERVRQRCLEKGASLTLDQAITIGRLFEATKDGMKVIDGNEDPTICKIDKSRYSRGHHRSNKKSQPKSKQDKSEQSEENCRRCGYETHKPQGKCPARQEKCSACGKKGHFAKVCFSKTKKQQVHTVEYSSEESDSAESMNMIHIKSLKIQSVSGRKAGSDEWWETIQVGQAKLKCQLDTGARGNVMSYIHLRQVCKEPTLKETNKRLVSFSNQEIKPRGTIRLKLKYKGQVCEAKFYVIDGGMKPILSGETCKGLGLLERIHELDKATKQVVEDYPKLAEATGEFPGTVHLKIDPQAKPVVHAARRQPAALLPKIVDKLKEMESNGHIAKVRHPIDWVNSMVVSTRGDKIRICLDPSDLNKAIRREHYPMRTVEEIVSRSPQGKIFSVLDAKSGFLQMVLDSESNLLTTMNTPIGRYRWLRLPFGIKSAPELYQRAMDEMFEGIEDAYPIMDDILIVGKNRVHHDAVLKSVLERAQENNLKFNWDKAKIRKPRVGYMGHLLTENGLCPRPSQSSSCEGYASPRLQGSSQPLSRIRRLPLKIPSHASRRGRTATRAH